MSAPRLIINCSAVKAQIQIGDLGDLITAVQFAVMIDEVRNQSFIMGWTSCYWPVTLVDVHGKKIQTQESL